MAIITVVVCWNGASFKIKVDTDQPVEAFRLAIQNVTSVPCAFQKLMGFPGGVLKATHWSEVALKSSKFAIMMSICEAPIASLATAAPSCDADTLSNVQPHPAQFPRVPEAPPPSFATKLLSVSLKTPQGVAITVPGLPEHCLVSRVKFILSQPPYDLGQPLDMKLAYKGSILSDNTSLAAIGYDAQQFLFLTTNRESLVADAEVFSTAVVGSGRQGVEPNAAVAFKAGTHRHAQHHVSHIQRDGFVIKDSDSSRQSCMANLWAQPFLSHAFLNNTNQLETFFAGRSLSTQVVTFAGIEVGLRQLCKVVARSKLCFVLVLRLLCYRGRVVVVAKKALRHATVVFKRCFRFDSDVGTARRELTLGGHSGSVWCVAFHPRLALIATASSDWTAKLRPLSPSGGAEAITATLKGHMGCIYSIAFHSHLPLIATGSSDFTSKLWKLNSSGTSVIHTETLRGHDGYIYSVAFHASLALLATGSMDKTVKLWQISGEGTAAKCTATLNAHTSSVQCLAFHPSLNLLVSGSFDTTAKLWLLNSSGTDAKNIATLKGHSTFIHSVAFHPRLPLLATGSSDTTSKIWTLNADFTAAKCTCTMRGHSGSVHSVAFDPNLPLLATGSSDRTAKLWHVSLNSSTGRGVCLSTLHGHSDAVYSVAFHPSMPRLATGSGDNSAMLWK